MGNPFRNYGRSQNGGSLKACWLKGFDRKVLEDVANWEKM